MMKWKPKIKLTLKIKQYIWLAIASLVVVGLIASVIGPTFLRLEEKKTDITKILGDSALSDATAKNLIRAKRDREILEEYLEHLLRAFIQDGNPLPYLTELERLADEHSVTVDFSIQPNNNNGNAVGDFHAVSTTVVANGSWENIIGFLNDMMTMPIYFLTREIVFTTAPSEDESIITVTLTGITYWQ